MISLIEGDVILSRTNSKMSKIILKCTRGKGESPSRWSHADVVSVGGTPDQAWITGATGRGVIAQPLSKYDKPDRVFCIYRPYSYIHPDAIRARMQEFMRKKYPVHDLVLHFGDWLITRALLKSDVYLIRRLGGRTPTCGEYVGRLRRTLFGKHDWNQITPDDIDDYYLDGMRAMLLFEGNYQGLLKA